MSLLTGWLFVHVMEDRSVAIHNSDKCNSIHHVQRAHENSSNQIYIINEASVIFQVEQC